MFALCGCFCASVFVSVLRFVALELFLVVGVAFAILVCNVSIFNDSIQIFNDSIFNDSIQYNTRPN